MNTCKIKNTGPAVGLFEETLSYSPDNRDVYIGLLLAYYESGMLEKAKKTAKEMLAKGIGDYFDTVELYLMILVQLKEYDEMSATISALFDEQEIPYEKREHFFRLLEFANRMKKESPDESYSSEASEENSLQLLGTKDMNKLVLTIAELADKNARLYIDEIKEYLCYAGGHPFLKTMLLSILREQEYDRELVIHKFAKETTVIPAHLAAPDENEQKLEIEKMLKNRLENENPVLFSQIKGLLERQMFLLYPFNFTPMDTAVWAGAYHAAGNSFSGGETDFKKMALLYKTEEDELMKAYSFIQELEKISFPII